MKNEKFTIILPLPSKVLSPNCAIGSIGGRFAKAAAAKRQRRLACEAILQAGVTTIPWNRCSVVPRLYHSTNRKRDTDNAMASLKSAYDGIVDAGVVPDDTPDHMRRMEPEFFVDKHHQRLELEIERST